MVLIPLDSRIAWLKRVTVSTLALAGTWEVPGAPPVFGRNSFAYAFDQSGNPNEFSSGMKEYPGNASLIEKIRPVQITEVMNGYGLSMQESFVAFAT